jgi:hypothetical protein
LYPCHLALDADIRANILFVQPTDVVYLGVVQIADANVCIGEIGVGLEWDGDLAEGFLCVFLHLLWVLKPVVSHVDVELKEVAKLESDGLAMAWEALGELDELAVFIVVVVPLDEPAPLVDYLV